MTNRQIIASMSSLLAAAFLVLALLASLPVHARQEIGETIAHDFTFKAIDGDPLPLSKFAGRPLLVVNTASMCGFTHQYSDLQSLWDRYRQQGLVVLGVPSNDFGGQEPGTEREIKEFCEVNFNIDFPLTEKVRVKGSDAHPFYKWAVTELGRDAAPRWNFHKYLVTPTGELVAAFPTATSPTSPAVIQAVESLL